ncbi:MAG: MFS transporter [Chloroflexota bacterium]
MSRHKLFYGWVVVIAFLFIGITLYGIYFSFGVFFKSIETEFDLSRGATSAIASASLILTGLFAFLGGLTLDKFGPKIIVLFMGVLTGLSLVLTSLTHATWQLFLTYSLLLSMGTGALYVVPTSTVARWFNRRRGLTLGIADAGAGLGPVVIAPLATYLITDFNWRTAYLVVGLIAWLIILPLSRLLKKEPREIGAEPDGLALPANDHTEPKTGAIAMPLRQILKTSNLWWLWLVWFFLGITVFLIFTHLVPYLTDIDISPAAAAAVIGVIGASTIAGKIIMGAAADRVGRKLTSVFGCLLMTAAMLWLIRAHGLREFYAFAVVFGFAHGGLGASVGALIGDTFELTKIGTIFGILDLGWAAGAAIGPLLGGLIFDVTGSYATAFLIGAITMLAAALCVGLVGRKGGEHSQTAHGEPVEP